MKRDLMSKINQMQQLKNEKDSTYNIPLRKKSSNSYSNSDQNDESKNE